MSILFTPLYETLSPLNTGNYIVSDRFYEIRHEPKIPLHRFGAVLNCIYTIMSTELYGRANLGQGALNNMTYEASSVMIFDPRKVAVDIQLPDREVFPLHQELIMEDRREFDREIFISAGLSETELDDAYSSALRLVEDRLNKAASYK